VHLRLHCQQLQLRSGRWFVRLPTLAQQVGRQGVDQHVTGVQSHHER